VFSIGRADSRAIRAEGAARALLLRIRDTTNKT